MGLNVMPKGINLYHLRYLGLARTFLFEGKGCEKFCSAAGLLLIVTCEHLGVIDSTGSIHYDSIQPPKPLLCGLNFTKV